MQNLLTQNICYRHTHTLGFCVLSSGGVGVLCNSHLVGPLVFSPRGPKTLGAVVPRAQIGSSFRSSRRLLCRAWSPRLIGVCFLVTRRTACFGNRTHSYIRLFHFALFLSSFLSSFPVYFFISSFLPFPSSLPSFLPCIYHL